MSEPRSFRQAAEDIAGGATWLVDDIEAALYANLKDWIENGGKVCNVCGERKSLDKFDMWPNGESKSTCKVCRNRMRRQKKRQQQSEAQSTGEVHRVKG